MAGIVLHTKMLFIAALKGFFSLSDWTAAAVYGPFYETISYMGEKPGQHLIAVAFLGGRSFISWVSPVHVAPLCPEMCRFSTLRS